MADKAFHDSQDRRYRAPFGAVPAGDEIFLALDAPEDAVCTLRLWTDGNGETKVPMPYGGDHFFTSVAAPKTPGLMWYYFIIERGGSKTFLGAPDDGLGGVGKAYSSAPPAWQITVYAPSPAPEWYKQAVVYQIFPDRFCRGEDWKARRENAVRDENRGGARRIWHEDWNDKPFYTKNPKGEVTRWDFFGGTLEGIREKLPYLRSLGVGAIYLNPIFLAASNHRYDTADYRMIDPALGDTESFERLAAEAREHGIRLILDGVFSHTGADSRYFDFFGNFGGGAYTDPGSPYRSWYRFKNYPTEYESWWGVGDLPNVDEENPDYKAFICTDKDSVARTWLRHGASGWRLDVADELPDSFIADFRTAIKAERGDALLLGEVWEDASHKRSYGTLRHYLLGSELDATMHYPFRTAVTDFLLGKTDAYGLRRQLMSLAENYPPEALYSALNLIGSHDRARPITVLGEAPESLSEQARADYTLTPEHYALGRDRLKLAALLQYACPGVPCVYYGDEAGLTGYEDPDNRGTYPWGREDQTLLSYYRALGKIYADTPALKSGGFDYLCYDEDVFACRRSDGSGGYVAVVNRSKAEKRVPLRGMDLLTGKTSNGILRLAGHGCALIKTEEPE